MKKIFIIISLIILSFAAGAQVNLAGYAQPINTGSYPTHIDSLGYGGLQVVADTNARNNITTLRRKSGMVVLLKDSLGIGYQLVGGIANTNWVKISLNGSGFKIVQRNSTSITFLFDKGDSTVVNFSSVGGSGGAGGTDTTAYRSIQLITGGFLLVKTNYHKDTVYFTSAGGSGGGGSATDTTSLSNRINQKTDKVTTLTINSITQDLSTNRSWTLNTDNVGVGPSGNNLYTPWKVRGSGIDYGTGQTSLVSNVGIKALADSSKLLIQNEEGRSGIVIRGVGSDEARTIPWYLNSTAHAIPLIGYGAMSNNVQAGIAANIVAIDMMGTQGANQSFLNAIRTAALQFNVAHTYDPSTGYGQVLDQAMVMIPDKFSPRVVITKFSSGDTSAMFQVGTLGDSTKGALLAPPLNTRQVNNLAAPMNGLIVRNIDSTGNNYFINTGTRTSPVWVRFGSGTTSGGSGGTVTLFSKTDNFGITSTVTNATTTPNHSIGVDTVNITSKAYTTAGLALKLNITDTVNKATRFAAGTNTSLSLSGNVLTINSTGGGTTGTEVYNELYTGSAGTSITTTNNPTVFKHLYKNGVLIYSPSDYTISGSTITLVVARLVTDKYSSDYKY